MKGHVIALDQGTTSSRAIIFNEKGEIVSLAQRPFPQIYPRPGWVEHDPTDILSSQFGALAEAFAKSGLERGGHRRHRRHQPARDRHRLGPRNGQARLQRHRLAVPAHGAHLRPPGLRGAGGLCPRQDGAADRRLLFRHQDQVDTGQRPRRARAGREGRAALRQRRLLAHLEPHRRARAHLRLLQLLAHHALRHRPPALGRATSAARWTCRC